MSQEERERERERGLGRTPFGGGGGGQCQRLCQSVKRAFFKGALGFALCSKPPDKVPDNGVNDQQFLTRILKFQRILLTKKRDENDVQKV